MDRDQFDKLTKALRAAHQERSYEDPGDDFTAAVRKRIRYMRAAESMREAGGMMFESAVFRFASAASAFALVLSLYGGSRGVGLTSATDMLPEQAISVIVDPAGLFL